MKVYLPGRIVDRHVGGNTTYARELRSGLEARGVSVPSMPWSRYAAVTALRENVFAQRRMRDTVFHYSADTGPLSRPRTPSVVTVHGVASRWIRPRTPRQESIWRFRVGRAIAGADAVITVSESSATDIAETFDVDLETITVIPHGIDADGYREPTDLSSDVERQLPDRFALYVGNIEPRKNLVELAHAFQDPRVSGMPLVIAGKPAWNAAESMSAIESAPNVTYLGFVSDRDRVALMQRCEIFVFPSLYEGFGLPVLEAMAAGARVICTNAGSLAEVAGPAMRAAGTSRDELATAVAGALEDDGWDAEYSSRARRWVDSFTWETSVSHHLEVYRSIVS